MNLGKLITDYIDTVYPKHADENSEIFSDAIRSIRFLASRDWKEYEDRNDERPNWTKQIKFSVNAHLKPNTFVVRQHKEKSK